MYISYNMVARDEPGAYFTCQGVLTLKIRSPDRVSGLNVSQVPFSSNVSLERSNSRERFFDFCREPERTAFSLRTLFLSAIRIFFFFFLFFSPDATTCLRGDRLSSLFLVARRHVVRGKTQSRFKLRRNKATRNFKVLFLSREKPDIFA